MNLFFSQLINFVFVNRKISLHLCIVIERERENEELIKSNQLDVKEKRDKELKWFYISQI